MKSVIIGAGTYGQVYLSYLKEANTEIVGFIDDDKNLWGKTIDGIIVLGGKNMLPELFNSKKAEAIYCPIGNNKVRVSIMEYAVNIGFRTPNYIHPSVTISPEVKIGKGVYILLGSRIMPHTIIDDFVMISMSVNIAHHVRLCKGVFLSTGCSVGASMTLHENVYAGMNSTFVTGLNSIGANSLMGAGSVTLKDVEENSVMVGIPAKLLKKRY